MLIINSNSSATNIGLTVLASLPSALYETSGLHYKSATEIWTHNDGTGDRHLYRMNSAGTVTKTLTVNNSSNNDWEDITTDSAQTKMFIGDFGNNSNSRTDLKIYIVTHPSLVTGNSVSSQVINFNYPDQTIIPSPITNWNFDMEAFIHYRGMLYLFSKCGGTPLSLYTKLYSLPDSAGTYTATLIDSFYTGTRITSAAISPNNEVLVLLGNNNIHVFRNWSGTNFLSGSFFDMSMTNGWTQKEAVTFINPNQLQITDENTGTGNNLYLADLSQWIPNTTAIELYKNEIGFTVFPNPSAGFITITFENFEAITDLVIINMKGSIVYSSKSLCGRQTHDINFLNAGIYWVLLRNKETVIGRKKIFIE